MAFVHVKDRRLEAQSFQRPNAANANHDLLTHAGMNLAAVQRVCYIPIFLTTVFRNIGIEQIQLHAAHVDSPYSYMNDACGKRHLNLQQQYVVVTKETYINSTADCSSRLKVGIGHGVQDWMRQAGAAVASPLTLMREYVTALSDLLAGRSVTVYGRYVRICPYVRSHLQHVTEPRVEDRAIDDCYRKRLDVLRKQTVGEQATMSSMSKAVVVPLAPSAITTANAPAWRARWPARSEGRPS